MTDQPCPKCDGWCFTCTRTDPASLPNDTAKVRETPEAFVSEKPCLDDPFCTNPAHTRAYPALGYFPNGEPLHVHPTLAADMKAAGLWDDAKCIITGTVPVGPAPDNAPQGAGEGEQIGNDPFVLHDRIASLETQLAAKDAALSLAKKNNAALLRNLDIQEAEINNRDTLIRQLTGALQDATKYVEATHAMIKGAVGFDNVVLPVLIRCQKAIVAAERHEKGEV